jgi:hypothetical protein
LRGFIDYLRQVSEAGPRYAGALYAGRRLRV